MISITAAVKIKLLEESLPGARVIRAVLNFAVRVEEEATAISPGSKVTVQMLTASISPVR